MVWPGLQQHRASILPRALGILVLLAWCNIRVTTNPVLDMAAVIKRWDNLFYVDLSSLSLSQKDFDNSISRLFVPLYSLL